MTEIDLQDVSQDATTPPLRSADKVVHVDAKCRSVNIKQPLLRACPKYFSDLVQNCSELIWICSEMFRITAALRKWKSQNPLFRAQESTHLCWEFPEDVYTKEGPSRDLGDGEGAVCGRIFWEDEKIKCKSIIYWKSILNNSEHSRNFWTFPKIARKSDLKISSCSMDPGWCAHRFSESGEVAGPRYPLRGPAISGTGISWNLVVQIPGIELTTLFVVVILICAVPRKNRF